VGVSKQRRCYIELPGDTPGSAHLAIPMPEPSDRKNLTVTMEFEVLNMPAPHDAYLFEWATRDVGGDIVEGIEIYVEGTHDFFAVRWAGLGTGGYGSAVVNKMVVGTHYFIKWRVHNVSLVPPIQTAYQAVINGSLKPPWPVGNASMMLLPEASAMVGRGMAMRIWQLAICSDYVGEPLMTGYPFVAHPTDLMRFNFDEGSGMQVHDASVPHYNGEIIGNGWSWNCAAIPNSSPRGVRVS